MRVLNLSLGRTGTASMQKALTLLDYPTYHGFEMHANKPDNDMWLEAFDAKYRSSPPFPAADGGKDWEATDWRKFFDQLLGHVSAVTDLPCNAFAPELIAAYPDAKVILVERDIDSWYRSWENALIKSLEMPGLDLYARFDADIRKMLGVAREGVMKLQFHAQTTDEYRERAKPTYREHYAEVRRVLAEQPERLLKYKLGSGWEPLCGFLGTEVPSVPFPHVNESAVHDEMGDVVKVIMARNVARIWFTRVLPLLVLLAAVWWQLRK